MKVHHAGTTILIDESGKVTVTAEPQIDINCQGGARDHQRREGSDHRTVGDQARRRRQRDQDQRRRRGDHRIECEVHGNHGTERDHWPDGEAKLSSLAPLPSHHVYALLADDLTWFFRTPELRVLHVATTGTERPVALHQLTLSEGHAFNHSPFFVLEDAHLTIEPGWLVRAERVAMIHSERRDVLAPEGITLQPIPPVFTDRTTSRRSPTSSCSV